MYPALSGTDIPREWKTYDETISGEIFAVSQTKFRLTTKYIRYGFLANYPQHGQDTEMIVKKFKFTLGTA